MTRSAPDTSMGFNIEREIAPGRWMFVAFEAGMAEAEIACAKYPNSRIVPAKRWIVRARNTYITYESREVADRMRASLDYPTKLIGP